MALSWSRLSEETRFQVATGIDPAASPTDPLCQPNAVPCAAGYRDARAGSHHFVDRCCQANANYTDFSI